MNEVPRTVNQVLGMLAYGDARRFTALNILTAQVSHAVSTMNRRPRTATTSKRDGECTESHCRRCTSQTGPLQRLCMNRVSRLSRIGPTLIVVATLP
jgi:hypothetical protein